MTPPTLFAAQAFARALAQAIEGQHEELISLLLPLATAGLAVDDSAALYAAVLAKRMDLVEQLLPHSEPHAKHGRALTAAIAQRQTDLVARLLPTFPALGGRDWGKAFALFTAAQVNDTVSVAALWGRYPAQAHLAALESAAMGGHLALIEHLVQRIGANPDRLPADWTDRVVVAGAHGHQPAVVAAYLPRLTPNADVVIAFLLNKPNKEHPETVAMVKQILAGLRPVTADGLVTQTFNHISQLSGDDRGERYIDHLDTLCSWAPPGLQDHWLATMGEDLPRTQAARRLQAISAVVPPGASRPRMRS